MYFSLKKASSHAIFVSDTCNTRVGAMGCPKGIVHIDISQPRELFSKFLYGLGIAFDLITFSVREGTCFLRVESNVLAEEDFTFGLIYLLQDVLSDTVIQEFNRSPQEAFKRLDHRTQRVALVAFSVGPALVGEEDQRFGVVVE